MPFFDDEYVNGLARRYAQGDLPKLARPAFRLATQDGWRNLRNEIETFYAGIDESSQARLRRRRRDLENIAQTINEIKVGIYLRSLGFTIEYEKAIDKVTPDWFVSKSDGTFFVVEVFSKRNSDQKNLEEGFLSDLRDHCRDIRVGAILALRLYMRGSALAWTDGLVSQIGCDIENWLARNPAPTSQVEIGGIEIELCDYSPTLGHVELLPFSDAFWVNTQPVENAIEEKVIKYQGVCCEYSLPFVAVCCPSFSTAIEAEEFERICPRLFSKFEYLTSVWAFIEGRVKVLSNPGATFALADPASS